jgi:hypothetical protein
MKYKLLFLSVLLSATTLSAESLKNLTFYKDLTHYKEQQTVNLNEKVYLSLSDTAVLDTFNVSLKKDGKLLEPKSIEIHPKNEENIFKLNKNQTVYVNEKEYTLIENGKGFIKLKNKNGLVTFIPKHKIEEISFTNDINSSSHIAQVVPYEKHEEVELAFSYALGEMSWKPKYDIYLKNKTHIQLDYNIEINNDTLSSFEDVNVVFMLEEISRYYNDFTSSKNGGLFDFEQHIIHSHYYYDKRVKKGFDKNGFNRAGFNAEGYDKDGYNMNGYDRNSVSSTLFDGKRGFSFSNIVDVPAKSKTLYPFKNAIEMSYEKTNTVYLSNSAKKKSVYVPTSSIAIKNDTGITMSKGVVRVFSGDKGFDSTVIKEFSLNGNKGNEDLKVSLGDNYSIKVNVLDNKEVLKSEYKMSDIMDSFNLKSNRILSGWDFEVKELDLSIINEDGEKELTLSNHKFIKEDKKEELFGMLNILNNKSDSKTEAFENSKKINKLLTNEIKIDLSEKKETTKKVYILVQTEQYIKR